MSTMKSFDSGGALWYDLFNCVFIGLLLGTLSLLGLAALYGSSLQLLALAPLALLCGLLSRQMLEERLENLSGRRWRMPLTQKMRS